VLGGVRSTARCARGVGGQLAAPLRLRIDFRRRLLHARRSGLGDVSLPVDRARWKAAKNEEDSPLAV
jgi:hypothetical protein